MERAAAKANTYCTCASNEAGVFDVICKGRLSSHLSRPEIGKPSKLNHLRQTCPGAVNGLRRSNNLSGRCTTDKLKSALQFVSVRSGEIFDDVTKRIHDDKIGKNLAENFDEL